MSKGIDSKLIRSLSPINSLNPENIQDLLSKIKPSAIPAGKLIFKQGDTEKSHVYLLKGEVELIRDNKLIKRIKAGTADGLHPLVHAFPRTASLRTREPSVITRINSDMLDIMLTWDQTGNNAGENFDDDDETDWMGRILQTPAFHRIPPANIQAIFMRMESVSYGAGEKVVEQGQEGDYFYIIKKGRCLVTRSTAANAMGVKLANLSAGDSFGEEALISDSQRNATVTMLSKGQLMRLNKENFNSLLKEPLLNWVDYAEAQQMVEQGAIWFDVRLPAEHEALHIADSVNVPLIFLRMKAHSLDASKKYVVYCDTGRRSSAASFLLNEKEIEACVLSGGIDTANTEHLISE